LLFGLNFLQYLTLNVQQTFVRESSFFKRDNDLQFRGWSHRLFRFFRAHLKGVCVRGELLADDPRVFLAWKNGWDTAHFMRFLRWRDEGFNPEVVYDIGAHEGLWSEMCQKVFSPRTCFLFEPQAEFQDRIRARQKRLGVEWTVLPLGLGDREEKAAMYLTQNLAASSLLQPVRNSGLDGSETKTAASQQVSIRRLDDLVQSAHMPAPDLVKIDVQGFEGSVIAGGSATLAKAGRIVVEVSLHHIYENQPLLHEILQAITSLNFRLDDISETLRTWPSGRLWQVDLWFKRHE
jgi:FkbM family methyltransferase